MTVPVFVDTNIAAYAFGEDKAKKAKARALLANHPTISTQVVNEFLNVCRVKLKIDVATRHRLARELMAGCDVVTVNPTGAKGTGPKGPGPHYLQAVKEQGPGARVKPTLAPLLQTIPPQPGT